VDFEIWNFEKRNREMGGRGREEMKLEIELCAKSRTGETKKF